MDLILHSIVSILVQISGKLNYIHTLYYNFCRIHQTLRCTPAMAAGVTDTLWEVEDIINLIR